MFTFFKQYTRKTGAVLFAIQLLIVFALPIDAAYAAGTSRPGNDVCFALDQCFATMGECQAAAGGKICSDPKLTKSGVEGYWTTRINELGVAYEKAKNTVKDTALSGTVKIVGVVLEFIAKYVAKFALMFMRSMGHILDMAIGRTINGETYRNLTAVLVGWTAVRDFSNMLFIFVLLYIAIQTILGLATSNVKRLLSHVVIAALLINFSLFFTQVVIDAGNILAMGFWNQMTTKQGTETFPSASASFLQGFRMQTIFDINGDIMTETPGSPLKTTSMDNAMIYAGGAIMMFVAGYVFLAGAVIMIVRTVWLLILMIGSPFAFVSFALPSRGGFASWWWGQLVGQVFVAPAFLFMLYICSLIISNNDLNMMTGAINAKFAPAILGGVNNYAIFYNFAVIVILLLACLTVASKVSSGAGSMGSSWAKKIIGGGAALGFAGVAAAGRQTYGRNAAASLKDKDGKETEWAKKQRQLVAAGGMSGKLANARLALAEKGAKGTYDIRNAPMGGLGVTAALGKAGISTGAGSKKSYETHGQALGGLTGGYRGTDKEKELIATAKARFPDDPAAQKAYLEGRGVALDASRNKDIKSSIDRDTVKKAAKETLDREAKKQGELDKRLKSATLTPAQKQEAEIEGKAIASAVGVEMRKLSVNERAELAEKYRDNSAYINNLSKGDFAAIHRLEVEGKFKEPVIQNIVQQVMVSEDPSKADLQKYLMKDETQEKLFAVDMKNVNTDRFNEMKKRAAEAKAAEKTVKTSGNSSRFQELFTKQNRTPAEDAELKSLTAQQ